MRYVMWLFWLFLIVCGIGFSSINAYRVPLHLYVSNPTVYLPLLLLSVLCVGVLIGLLLLTGRLFKQKMINHKLSRELKQSQQEIKQLRRIAIDEDSLTC